MDRQVIYTGQIPQDTDQLLQSKNTMIGLGFFMQAAFGTNIVADGLAVTPTSPASMSVKVAPGSIYAIQNVDGTAFGSVAADTTHQIIKQGIALASQTLSCPAPVTSGQSVVYLVQAIYQDVDAGSTTLPYYNAADPTSAWSGPGNAGTAQNTVRKGVCNVTVKAGTPATTGTQATPAPDAGYTGLYAVTVANGATTITGGNISLLATAPFIAAKLPAVPSYIQSGAATYAQDSGGAANAIAVALYPIPAALTTGQVATVKVANTNTGATVMNVNGLGNVAVHTQSGAALQGGELKANGFYVFVYDGNYWQLQGGVASGHGQCRLKMSGSNLLLAPLNGNRLIIGGNSYPIPSSGVSLAPSGLTTSAVYFIYAYMNSGTMALEASGTGHATDTATGVEVKSGDATRTLVGQWTASGTSTWSSGALDGLSYFNRRTASRRNNFTANRSTTSTNYVEVNTEIRVPFLCWPDEAVNVNITGAANNSNSTFAVITAINIDGSVNEDGFNYTLMSANTNTTPVSLTAYLDGLAEGQFHYATLAGKVTGNTGTLLGGAAGGTDITVLQVQTRG